MGNKTKTDKQRAFEAVVQYHRAKCEALSVRLDELNAPGPKDEHRIAQTQAQMSAHLEASIHFDRLAS